MKIIHFDSLNSTNTYLKDNYKNLNDMDVISTSHQTEGKGRFGNVWLDDHGSALFSVLIKRNLDVASISQVPLVAATSCHKVLSKYISNLYIKWPNDLMVNDKKIAGILTESIIENQNVQALIVGIGINVSHLDFHETISHLATSIYKESKKEVSISHLIEEISSSFHQELLSFESKTSDFIEYCKIHSNLLNKEITFYNQGVESNGIAIDINQLGNLIVKTKHGIIELNSGQVQLKHNK